VRKATLALVALVIMTVLVVSLSSRVKIVEAAEVEGADYNIEHVNHTIEVLYNGYVIINDSVTINATGQAPSYFLIGFPYVYSSSVIRCDAYNESDVFPVSLNVPLESHIGFYGAKVGFPRGIPETFTVLFVLSNDLVSHDTTDTYSLNFPAVPSFTETAAVCNVSIVLPEGASYLNVTDNIINYSEENLPAFAYNQSQISFSLADDKLEVVDIDELDRQITVNELGQIGGTDTYRIKNKAALEVSSIEVMLPINASNPTAADQFGRKMTDPVQTDQATNRYNIAFSIPLASNEYTRFSVKYTLPDVWVTQEQANNFVINFSFFRNVNYYVGDVSTTFVLPEGAKILSYEATLEGGGYSLARNVFQETVAIDRQGMFSLDSFNVGITYEYNPLWLSFRPTMWIWALSVVVCAVVFWRRPRGAVRVTVPTVAVSLRSEHLRSFVDAYEERTKILSEIEALESRVQKGRIQRRRYKVQRKTLETRAGTLSRNLTELKEKMYAAGGRYADLMHQLEVAETEIKEVEVNIKSIKARQSRGDLSLEAYRRLLTDYQRRQERAQTTIDGILLRLREEIR
jgi:hypothetical protein